MPKGQRQQEKSKVDRLKETITILKKLMEVGIMDHTDAYLQTKEYLDEWIKTGEEAQHLIDFSKFRRTGILTLPKYADKAAELILRATR
jgi:hypothetical protein